jgi:amidophosphoribosyltransferase
MIHEACGVFGMYSPQTADLAHYAVFALYALQHRGQESAGVVINNEGVFYDCRHSGLAADALSQERIAKLPKGEIAVGHVRYATTGANSIANIQPLLVNHHKGRLALAHNGNLVNALDLRKDLEERGAIFHTTTDSEVIAYEIVQARLKTKSIEEAVVKAMDRLEGAYSLVISSPTKLIAVRDPFGFRPLCMGKLDDMTVFASETTALDAIGAQFVRDVLPGEVITVSEKGISSDTSHCGGPVKTCVFEYIYFARPDSVIDGCSVCLSRYEAGKCLAKEHPVQADAVVGVPDSGIEAAIGYAAQSGIPYVQGFTKNKYIGRTFISPTQAMRQTGVNIKLNPIKAVIEGKRIVLIDDSIVRGTTCRRTIDMLRKAGAKEVHLRVSSPPFVECCYYGTDIDHKENLIANLHTPEEIADMIGADSLGYLSLESAGKIAGRSPDSLCMACFGGGFPTSVPKGDKDRFEQKIKKK